MKTTTKLLVVAVLCLLLGGLFSAFGAANPVVIVCLVIAGLAAGGGIINALVEG